MSTKVIKSIYYVAALYDGLFGVMGIFSPFMAFEMFEVPPPNHVGYIQFPAILLLIFGAMFWQIARDPVGNRSLIPYGIALKVGYSGLIFYYLLTIGIPAMWVPWAWIDLGFLIVFVLCWNATARGAAGTAIKA
ncbi:MAG: hypothetical protein OEW59_01370 [Gammaproteobacteria bacterium]|nr:hypothetical protein [Gammaproteobacteria bacterium]